MPVEIELPSPEVVLALRDPLVEAYAATYTGPPYEETASEAGYFGEALATQVRIPGFRFALAREAGAVVGFACGYTSLPGQWWHDFLAALLDDERRARWLPDAFALVELAVIPAFQGRGIGGRLHQTVLAGLPHRTALLNVLQADIPAARLYRTRGWVPLHTGVVYSYSPHPCTIMGLDLKHFTLTHDKEHST